MKELSIEEKAEAYDGNYKAYTELINRIEDVKEAIKKQNYGIAMDILCKPYPQFQVITHSELKESEDEKIRKEIISALKFANVKGVYDKHLACLEKQVEQKLYVNDNAKEMFIKALERVEEQNNKGYKLTDCDKNSWWEDFKAYTSCIIEQKSAWSEKDEAVLDALIRRFKGDDIYVSPNSAVECLKSLKERYTWRPSDEQIHWLKWAINRMPDTEIANEADAVLEELLEQLKKLMEE